MTHRQTADLLYAIERAEQEDVLDTYSDLCEVFDLLGDLPKPRCRPLAE
jgi:hypothetical protein